MPKGKQPSVGVVNSPPLVKGQGGTSGWTKGEAPVRPQQPLLECHSPDQLNQRQNLLDSAGDVLSMVIWLPFVQSTNRILFLSL